jgi:hypothetical protein
MPYQDTARNAMLRTHENLYVIIPARTAQSDACEDCERGINRESAVLGDTRKNRFMRRYTKNSPVF